MTSPMFACTRARAAESARAVAAVAYTVGRDVVFGEGGYNPGSALARRILAHELVHVVQQRSASATPEALHIDSPGSASEREAEAIAGGSAGRVRSRAGPGRIQRLGANPGCTPAEAAAIHQAIFDARGWLLKATPQLEATPLSGSVLARLRRNFGPTYGEAVNAGLIAGRLKVAYQQLSTIPFSCANAANATCATAPGVSASRELTLRRFAPMSGRPPPIPSTGPPRCCTNRSTPRSRALRSTTTRAGTVTPAGQRPTPAQGPTCSSMPIPIRAW